MMSTPAGSSAAAPEGLLLPDAVLWDMDGTLVDTEPYWMRSEIALVRRFGGDWDDEQALTLVGSGLDRAATILQGAGVALSVAEIVATLTEAVRHLLRTEGVPFRPGARELLAELRERGVRTALVTMSMRAMALDVASAIGADAFDLIVAGDDVPRPKPHPDPYLQACTALGVSPSAAVAVEDSPIGVRSARAAGTVTLGVPFLLPLEEAGPHGVWPTLDGRTVDHLAAFYAHHRELAA